MESMVVGDGISGESISVESMVVNTGGVPSMVVATGVVAI
jgi:hypothetical protein